VREVKEVARLLRSGGKSDKSGRKIVAEEKKWQEWQGEVTEVAGRQWQKWQQGRFAAVTRLLRSSDTSDKSGRKAVARMTRVARPLRCSERSG
jgi:hypothetical protein